MYMLLHLVLSSRTTFEERQKRKAKKEEIEEVKNLDHWRPADFLSPVLQLPESHG